MIYLVIAALVGLTVWQGRHAIPTLQRHRDQMTLRATWRTVSWWGMAGSLGLMALLLLSDESIWADKGRALEIAVPLVMGIQAAVLFSPTDEAALEILLSYPRPVAWVMLERLGLALGLQAVIVLGVGGGFALLDEQSLGMILARWLPPTVFLTGLGAYVTLKSRVMAFGVTVTVLMWFGFLAFGPLLIPGEFPIPALDQVQRHVWMINPYLDRNNMGNLAEADYWLNRVAVTLVGSYLITLAAAYLRDEERVLLGATVKKSVKGVGA
jgi:hypothetical protein